MLEKLLTPYSAVAALVEEGGPFVFWDDLAAGCAHAAELGFDAVEIFPPGAEALDVAKVAQLLGAQGLHCAAIGTGAGWVKHKLRLTDPDAAVRQGAIGFVGGIIDAAGALGAPAIIGSMQGRWGDGVARDQALDCWAKHWQRWQNARRAMACRCFMRR